MPSWWALGPNTGNLKIHKAPCISMMRSLPLTKNTLSCVWRYMLLMVKTMELHIMQLSTSASFFMLLGIASSREGASLCTLHKTVIFTDIIRCCHRILLWQHRPHWWILLRLTKDDCHYQISAPSCPGQDNKPSSDLLLLPINEFQWGPECWREFPFATSKIVTF